MKDFMLLFIILSLVIMNSVEPSVTETMTSHAEDEQYCHLCTNHTMCLYPFDDSGPDCAGIESGDLEREKILAILHEHNQIRNTIAEGKEVRGNPGPQPAAQNMMEMTWDDELAAIARRWALQCKLSQKDTCRDVERFSVLQNVNLLKLNASDNSTTSLERIESHVRAWQNEVLHFDAAQVEQVHFDLDLDDYSAYFPLASANVDKIGCAHYLQTVGSSSTIHDDAQLHPGERVEVLVCNYGPVDRRVPQPLYEMGVPGLCRNGTMPSLDYESLCTKCREQHSRKKVNQNNQTELISVKTNAATGLTPFIYIYMLTHYFT